jgi:hypothetical protein
MPGIPMSTPGDASERAADGLAAEALRGARTPDSLAHGLGIDLNTVGLHTGSQAADSARALGARAYTIGSEIVFGDAQYTPETPRGARLLAHELAHVAQQRRSGVATLQRQSADVSLPEARITGALKPVATGVRGLGELTTPPGPFSISREDENAPDSTQPLPFTTGGWEAGELLTRLGQFDDMAGTDSDAVRCVQSVAMSSYVVDGPQAVRLFLNAVLLDAAMSRPQGARENKAREVLDYFMARLDNRTATYGDMSWAQEALHDLFYVDTEGTPETDVAGLLAKTHGPERDMLHMDVWCDSPADVVAQAKLLEPGQQLLVVPVTVIFNKVLDDAAPNPTDPQVDAVDVTRADDTVVRVTRFDASVRPPSSAINAARDQITGHQILIMRDSSTGELRVYEPEVGNEGDHFMELAEDGRNFEREFLGSPAGQFYGYVHVIGKITPKTLPPRMFAQYRPSWL